jgi:CHU_C Type IX secretion signal domain
MKNHFSYFSTFYLILICFSYACNQDESKTSVNEKYKDCCGTDPKVIELPGGNSIYVPNVFTPNNDGINDLFYPIAKDQDIKKFSISELKIFNTKDTVIYYRRDFSYTIDLEAAAWSGQMRENIFNETPYTPDQKYDGGPFKYSFEAIYVLSDGSLEVKLIEGQACMIRCEDEVSELRDRIDCFFPVQGLGGAFDAQIGNQEDDCFK